MKTKQFRVVQGDFIFGEFDSLKEARHFKKSGGLFMVYILRLNRLTGTWGVVK